MSYTYLLYVHVHILVQCWTLLASGREPMWGFTLFLYFCQNNYSIFDMHQLQLACLQIRINKSANPWGSYIACYNSMHRWYKHCWFNTQLGYSQVSCLVYGVESVHLHVCTCYSPSPSSRTRNHADDLCPLKTGGTSVFSLLEESGVLLFQWHMLG